MTTEQEKTVPEKEEKREKHPKWVNLSLRFIQWSFVFVLTVTLLLQLALWGGIAWINTQNGQNFIQKTINSGVEQTGQRISIDGLALALPTRLYLRQVTLYQNDEKQVQVKNINLKLQYWPPAEKHLKIALSIGELTLFKTEKEQAPSTDIGQSPLKPLVVEPIDLASLYFNAITIEEFAINKLYLDAEDQNAFQSPKIRGEILRSDNILSVDLSMEMREPSYTSPIPQTLELQGFYNANTSTLGLKKFIATAHDYTLDAKLDAVFKQDETFKAIATLAPLNVKGLTPIKAEILFENTLSPRIIIKANGAYYKYNIGANAAITAKDELINIGNLRLNLPELNATGQFTLNTATNDMNGNLTASLNSLSPYISLIGADHKLDPTRLRADISVKNGAPFVDFKVNTSKYHNNPTGLELLDIALTGTYSPSEIIIKSLTAKDNKTGTLRANATINPNTQDVNAHLSVSKLNAIKGDIAKGTINLDLDMLSQGGAYKISGKIKPETIAITLPERFDTQIPQLNIVKKNTGNNKNTLQSTDVAKTTELDIIIDAPNQIFVRGWGLDAEFGGNLKITGKLNNAQYYGNLDMIRGRYSEFGRNFKLPRGKLLFNGSVPPSPKLDILAQTKVDDITAQIEIGGSAEKPKIGFSAIPAMPEDEVISHILFGKSASDITPFQAVQLSQALQRFSGKGGRGPSIDPMGLIRSATGLDDLRVETSEEGGATVGAGKYLSENVYLELETGSEQGQTGATIEIELTPNITVESEIGQDAQGGAGIFWKHDY